MTELLVVISIIVVLMGLLLPALRAFKTAGLQSSELSAARQLMIAYNGYANGNNDYVMPGYWTKLKSRDAAGKWIPPGLISARYPWRLAPYLDYNFRGLYLNQHQEKLEELEQRDPDDETEYQWYLYTVSLYPSLALNTAWVGGDEGEGAFDLDPATGAHLDIRAFGPYYVRTLSHVRHTDRLMVFASARGGNPLDASEINEGYFRLRSPYRRESDGYRWAEEWNPSDEPDQWGFVSPRYDDRAVTAFADGHTDILDAEKFTDMRYWANGADRKDWMLEPVSD